MPDPEFYCKKCEMPVRAEPSVQKKASKSTPAGTNVWRCPRCTQDSNITTNVKRIEYTPGSDKITIEKFGCRWDGCNLKLQVKNSVATEYFGPL